MKLIMIITFFITGNVFSATCTSETGKTIETYSFLQGRVLNLEIDSVTYKGMAQGWWHEYFRWKMVKMNTNPQFSIEYIDIAVDGNEFTGGIKEIVIIKKKSIDVFKIVEVFDC
ncbi:MAG: hypothetical protein H6620_05320 [Halobacteriovoraceae bacterium]|nr:hypothetical protein [Halobacteriovoraceae bacterium]